MEIRPILVAQWPLALARVGIGRHRQRAMSHVTRAIHAAWGLPDPALRQGQHGAAAGRADPLIMFSVAGKLIVIAQRLLDRDQILNVAMS